MHVIISFFWNRKPNYPFTPKQWLKIIMLTILESTLTHNIVLFILSNCCSYATSHFKCSLKMIGCQCLFIQPWKKNLKMILIILFPCAIFIVIVVWTTSIITIIKSFSIIIIIIVIVNCVNRPLLLLISNIGVAAGC